MPLKKDYAENRGARTLRPGDGGRKPQKQAVAIALSQARDQALVTRKGGK
jgi:hypothetical protein